MRTVITLVSALLASIIGIRLGNDGLEFLLPLLPFGVADIVGFFALEGRWFAIIAVPLVAVVAGVTYKSLIVALLLASVATSVLGLQSSWNDLKVAHVIGRMVTDIILICLPAIVLFGILRFSRTLVIGRRI